LFYTLLLHILSLTQFCGVYSNVLIFVSLPVHYRWQYTGGI